MSTSPSPSQATTADAAPGIPSQKSPSHPVQKLQGTASRSYTVASTWEELAPLTTAQASLIDQLSGQCCLRPLPRHVTVFEGDSPQEKQLDEQAKPMRSGGVDNQLDGDAVVDLESAVLKSSQTFYQWHAKLEAFRAREAEEKYREYADTLMGHLDSCGRIETVIDGTVEVLEGVMGYHKDAVGR